MITSNKSQSLLTDLWDKLLGRRWHVRCLICSQWEVRNLKHRRFAQRRVDNHIWNEHNVDSARIHPIRALYRVWSSRA